MEKAANDNVAPFIGLKHDVFGAGVWDTRTGQLVEFAADLEDSFTRASARNQNLQASQSVITLNEHASGNEDANDNHSQ